MLGILLIYYIGKKFYELSDIYDKNKWLYAITSVVLYYVTGIVLIAILVILDDLFYWGFDWESRFGINLISVPVGLFSVWLLYNSLEKRWKASAVSIQDEIQDIGKNTI